MYSLEGKIVLITGASDGIGAQLALALKRRGGKLSLTARRESKLREIGGAEAAITAGDLTEEAVRRSAVDNTIARFGRLDVLINNAGRGLYFKASDTPIDDARRLMELNFFAPAALAQLAIPYLKAVGGTIVNVSSIAGQMSLPWLPYYSASKFALASLTASQRMELKRHGVHVLCVYPGYVTTGFQDHAEGPRPPQLVVRGKRFAITPERCAEAILRGIEKRKRTVVTPSAGWIAVWLNRFFPGVVESRMSNQEWR